MEEYIMKDKQSVEEFKHIFICYEFTSAKSNTNINETIGKLSKYLLEHHEVSTSNRYCICM